MKESLFQSSQSASLSRCAYLFLLAHFSALAFGAPVEIPGAEPGKAAQPQLAVGPEGRIHVVFGEKKSGAILFSSSEPGGKVLSMAVEIGRLPQLALGLGRGPKIATIGHNVVVTAISHEDGMLHGWHSRDDGKTWKETSPLNGAPASAKEGLHSMAATEGIAAVVWLDCRSDGTEVRAAVSKNGGVTWEADVLVYKSPAGTVCECCRPSIAVRRDGKIAVMWRNLLEGSRDMWISESGDVGESYGAGRKIGSGTWKLNGCPMDGGGVVFKMDGEIKTAWRRERSVFLGSSGDDERELDGNALRPDLLVTGDSELCFYEKGGNLVVHGGPDKNPQILAEGVSFPSGAVLPDRQLVFAWEPLNGNDVRLMLEVFDKR